MIEFLFRVAAICIGIFDFALFFFSLFLCAHVIFLGLAGLLIIIVPLAVAAIYGLILAVEYLWDY